MNEEELGECEIGEMNCKLQPGGQNAVTSLYKGTVKCCLQVMPMALFMKCKVILIIIDFKCEYAI